MKLENISHAIGYIDDDIIEAVDMMRNRKTKIYWRRWTAISACVCFAVIATVFFYGFPIIGARGGGNLGHIVNGSYYYKTDFNFYSYSAGKRERLMSSFNVRGVWRADENGIYYIKGRSLYVRELESGKSRKLYTAGTEIWIRYFENSQITLWWRDKKKLFDGLQFYVCIDGKTGDIVWQEELTHDEEMAIIDKNIIQNSSIVTIPNGRYLTGTDDYLFFSDDTSTQKLYSYNVKTKETTLLYEGADMDVYTAVTDGIWLFTNAPWSGKTDCWKLIYNEAGDIIGLELWEAGI